MVIASKQTESIEDNEQIVFYFPKGLYGLEEFKQYELIIPDETLPFAYLQAKEVKDICLLVANPFAFFSDYQFELSETDLEALHHPDERSVAVWVTVSIRESLQEATANLLAPIVINTEKQLGRQVVLHNSQYEIKTPLFPLQKGEE